MIASTSLDRTVPPWRALLATFAEAPPALVARRVLGHRCDTKFLLSTSEAFGVLEQLAPDYLVLPAAGVHLATYRTLYFDTPALASYHAHRRGRRVRHKARIRHYLDRCLSTLEVKTRRTEHLSTKASRPHPFLSDQLSLDDRAFVSMQAPLGGRLEPQVHTHFHRITLLHRLLNERVTFDLDLVIERAHSSFGYRRAVIVEVKQWPFVRHTGAMRALQHGGPGPVSLSKYCAAIAITCPRQPHHRFLPSLRRLAAIAQ